ncbi:MAG: SDR family NAD(P)-dependent oxidoreductase [Pseudomonadota bacterium]
MRVAVITGAAQGLGFETARQLSEEGLHVILTGRNAEALELTATKLNNAEGQQLDIDDADSVATFFDWLQSTHGRLDVVINNAGRIYGGHGSSFLSAAPNTLLDAISNNAIGAFRVMQMALPIMEKGGYGRIVNVSSGMGALSDMGAGAIPYRVSKTALNALTILAAREAPPSVKVNAVCPGWVRTDMGGQSAPRDVTTGARGIVWAAMLPEDAPSGGFFRDGVSIEW